MDPLAVGEFMPYLIDCGVVDDDSFESAGISADQFSCLFAELDTETLTDFMALAQDPSTTPDLTSAASLFAAMSTCGLDLQEILDAAGSTSSGSGGGSGGSLVPVISTDLLVCLTDNGVSTSLVSSYAVGAIDASDPALASALAACAGSGSIGGGAGGGGVVIPDGSGRTRTIDPSVFESLPISAEQVQCMIEELGAETLQGIVAGTVSPLTALGALSACDISITDLLAG